MEDLRAAGGLALLFALRCILPLLITVGFGYLMSRLANRWEAEAEAVRHGEIVRPGAPEPAQPALTGPIGPDFRCWVFHNCSAQRRERCAAFKQQNIPCWAARTQSEGVLPATCPGCPVYGAQLAVS